MDFSTARRKRRDLSIVMIDVDNFKQLNDTKGHAAGDAALCAIAQVLKREVRAGDMVSRYGGEEFVLLLPECNAATAVTICERIRGGLRLCGLDCGPVTISAGIAVSQASHANSHELLMDADEALYAAKHAGKDCVMQHSCCSTRELPMIWEQDHMPQEAYCG